MEHRCGARRAVNLTVLVRRRSWGGSIVARLANLSISGAFLEVPADSLPLHAVIHLETATPGGVTNRNLSCRAMVARVGVDGVGVVFDQLRPAGLAPLFAAPRVSTSATSSRLTTEVQSPIDA
jgi:hypothetical protein